MNRIRRIIIEEDDVTFYFDDSDEAFSVGEFEADSWTRKELERIEYRILDYNSEVDLRAKEGR